MECCKSWFHLFSMKSNALSLSEKKKCADDVKRKGVNFERQSLPNQRS